VALAVVLAAGSDGSRRHPYVAPSPEGEAERDARVPSIKAKNLAEILRREPLNYRVVRQSGSHRRLESSGRPTFAFHDPTFARAERVRAVLTKDVGLAETEELALL
jgi:predicted RNA binding protein YcfA (HicA-like mRNA interferase family)